MTGIATKSFDAPDEKRTPPNTEVAVVRLDAWVVGDEPVVAFEFESAESYAKG